MKVDNRKILIAIIIVALVVFPTIIFTSGALRITLGLLSILFFPGYTLLSVLFPKQGSIGGIERTALSFGLSIAVTPIIGLILNYTPWGITLYSSLITITLFILLTSAIAWYRQRRLPPSERFTVTVNISLPKWGKMGNLDRALSISLVVAVVAALGCLGYVTTIAKPGEQFTEFYILGVDGKAENYPKQVAPGEPVKLIIGIVNHEYAVTSYQVNIRINGIENKEIRTQALANEEKWEEIVSFIPKSSDERQKVEFWLYKNKEAKALLKAPLHLYIDIAE